MDLFSNISNYLFLSNAKLCKQKKNSVFRVTIFSSKFQIKGSTLKENSFHLVALGPFGLSPGRGEKCRPEDKKRSLKRKHEVKEKRKEGRWKSEVAEKKERGR